jgi:hypothetical protein
LSNRGAKDGNVFLVALVLRGSGVVEACGKMIVIALAIENQTDEAKTRKRSAMSEEVMGGEKEEDSSLEKRPS